MDDKSRIIETLKESLQVLPSVHAMWLEGSLAENDSDEYSDLDIWLSVDDDALRSIYKDIEHALETIAPIDFRLDLKPMGELGHIVYHLEGMSKFLSLDINTQKLSRDVVLREGIDIHKAIFDKSGIIRTIPREHVVFHKETEREDLLKFVDYMALSVEKNALRGKHVESREYYRAILIRVLEYLRAGAGISEKGEFGFKHLYKDISREQAKKLEGFYFSEQTDLSHSIELLKEWIRAL